MANLFEEWNSTSQGDSDALDAFDDQGGEDGGFGEEFTPLPDDEGDGNLQSGRDPIVSLKHVDLNRGSARSGRHGGLGRRTIKMACVSNNVLVIGTSTCIVMRIKLDTMEMEEIEISKQSNVEDNFHKLFLDPTGTHLLISLENRDSYYLYAGASKPKKLTKLGNQLLDSVGWDKRQTPSPTTKPFLVGTSQGVIYEVVIEGKEKYVKRVYSLQGPIKICGLQFEQFPQPNIDKFFVMIVTANPTRYYQFVGRRTFEELFEEYRSTERLRFNELPSQGRFSELHFFSKQLNERARSFAILTAEGVFHGNLLFSSQNAGDNVTIDNSFREVEGKDMNHMINPLVSLGVTEFHFLLLYPTRLEVISRLSDELVTDDCHDFDQERDGRMVGLVRDPAKGTYWLFSQKSLYQVNVIEEDRDVWKLFLQRAKKNGDPNDFETANQYCKDAAQRELVLTAQATHYFDSGDYERSAMYFAKTRRSFEEVALRFVGKDQNALKTFLLQKLRNLQPTEKTQLTIICTWLTELYLDKYNFLQATGGAGGAGGGGGGGGGGGMGGERDDDAHAQLLFEFKQFLREHKEHLNPATTFNLISSHGRVEEMLFYASIIEDFERVITHYIQRGEHSAALGVLKKASFSKVEPLFYKFSPVLMLSEPAETVATWERAANLDPCKLIPALVRYSQQQEAHRHRSDENYAIRYLEYCVKNGNKDAAIHNYLIALYAAHTDEDPLLRFLKSQDSRGGGYVFDLRYALRVCLRHKKKEACVHIYSAMELYEEAVNLALEVDLDLAKTNANQPDDDDLRKKLWLLIARHTIDSGGDIKDATEILKECPLLKIEDILPFCPDKVVIDDFKSEICQSLEEYNGKIERLKSEMKEYTQSAELIRKDIKSLRNRFGVVTADQRCMLSNKPILGCEFYLFPNNYAYIAEELIKEMMTRFPKEKRDKVSELQSLIAQTPQGPGASQPAPGMGGLTEREHLQQQLDDLVASECPLTGESMIDTITMPFISEEEEAESGEWELGAP